jgi:tryptophan synthase alpha chain
MENRAKNNRINLKFAELAEKQEKALITYIMAGDPDLAVTKTLVLALEEGGADIIELGIPFSDPLADGVVIQQAGQRALTAGTTLSKVLELVKELRTDTHIPLVLMSYYNPILRFGLEVFARQAAAAGVDGVIIPDLPCDESQVLESLLLSQGIYVIPLLAPTSTVYRIEQVAKRPGGFIYCVSLTGVTGAREGLPEGTQAFLSSVKLRTELPIAVGFGISKPEQVKEFSQHTDGVIVGSAIVKLVEKYTEDLSTLQAEIKQFLGKLKAELKN